MIVSHPARLFIATPTKTGTHSVEAIAARPANREALQVVGSSGSDTRRRMHRMAPNVEWASYTGHLLVRNPWTRWVSVYEYLRSPTWYAQWGARAVQGTNWAGPQERLTFKLGPPMTFVDFLGWQLTQRAEHYTPKALSRRGIATSSRSYRSPWVWLDSLTVSLTLLNLNLNEHGPAGLLHLERLDEELPQLLDGIDGLDLHVDQLNRSTNPTHRSWLDYWADPKARDYAARLGIDAEADQLGYPTTPEERP